jgi:hypothetical protein
MSFNVEILRVRKERVHATMLVEVLALLIFLSMAFAFVLRDDAVRLNPWKQKYDKAEAEFRLLRRDYATMSREVKELEIVNRQLLRSLDSTVAANDSLVINRAQWRELIQKLANAEAIVDAQQSDNSALRTRLAGRGGSDLPNCTVSPTAFILALELQEGGLRGSPLWPTSAQSAARQVPGLSELASGQQVTLTEFRALSAKVKAWGRQQAVPCNFRAVAYVRHNSMSAYRAQQMAIGDAFYTTYR